MNNYSKILIFKKIKF